MNKLLELISAILKCREIDGNDGTPYLQRFSILRTDKISIYLHKFVASDPDRGLHDHPFEWNISLILSGSYLEQLPDNDFRLRHPFSIAKFDGNHRHRVVLGDSSCWTLFIHGPRVKGWGFFKDNTYYPMSLDVNDLRTNDGWKKAYRKIWKKQ